MTARRLTAYIEAEIWWPVNLLFHNFQYGLKITGKRKEWSLRRGLLSDLVEAHGHVVPVDNAPPSIDILGPIVHVVEIVGVLPDINC